MPLVELLNSIEAKQRLGSSAVAERMELHQRISFAFVPLIFCLLGVALTLLARTARTTRSWGLMLCFFWLMAYYALLSFGKALGDKDLLHPVLAIWLPNLVVGGIAIHFFKQALRETTFFLPRAFESAIASAGQFMQTLKTSGRS
jgi:lipopolysaccharide export LptBFGC system permease protein LptF